MKIIKKFPGLWEIYIYKNIKLEEINLKKSPYIKIKAKFGCYVADPFIIKKENYLYIFYEEYDFIKSKGDLSCSKVNLITLDINTQTIIKDDFHLSFPFIFMFNDRFYLVPESCEDKSIRLYEEMEFPFKWNYIGNIISEIDIVDSIIYKKNHNWFLIGSHKSKVDIDGRGEVSIYYSDSPIRIGGWKKIPNNNNSENLGRNAGGLIFKDEMIIRPTQFSKNDYGEYIILKKIIKLTKDKFLEVDYLNIKSNSILIRNIHTVSISDSFVAVDLKIISVRNIILLIIYKLLRITHIIKNKNF